MKEIVVVLSDSDLEALGMKDEEPRRGTTLGEFICCVVFCVVYTLALLAFCMWYFDPFAPPYIIEKEQRWEFIKHTFNKSHAIRITLADCVERFYGNDGKGDYEITQRIYRWWRASRCAVVFAPCWWDGDTLYIDPESINHSPRCLLNNKDNRDMLNSFSVDLTWKPENESSKKIKNK